MRAPSREVPLGLAGLRRGGTVTELLFLYACETLKPGQLRPIASGLGLTVQAASHAYRQLARRGLVEVRDRRYLPTVRGVAWLHEALEHLREDVQRRLEQLFIIRSCRAIALANLKEGALVSLELRAGLLSARPGGDGPSHGRVLRGGRRGSLVEVTELEGIVALPPATVSILTLSEDDLPEPSLSRRIRSALPTDSATLLAAQGLVAYYALRASTGRPILRFAVVGACREAARIGVASCILVLESELPQLLAEFTDPNPLPIEVAPLPRPRQRKRDQ
jgi:predicted transcriptional regulator